MAGSYAPQLWPPLSTVLLLVALAIRGWRRRTVPGARMFAVTCLVAVPWVAGLNPAAGASSSTPGRHAGPSVG